MKFAGQTVLVVEDNSDDQFFIKRALDRLNSGLCVQFVASGDEAVAYLTGLGQYADRRHFPYPAFVITDLNMAEGDGFSVLRHLQSNAPSGTRVMMLSSSDEPEDERQAYGLGARVYCVKPQSLTELPPMLSTFLLSDESARPSNAMHRA